MIQWYIIQCSMMEIYKKKPNIFIRWHIYTYISFPVNIYIYKYTPIYLLQLTFVWLAYFEWHDTLLSFSKAPRQGHRNDDHAIGATTSANNNNNKNRYSNNDNYNNKQYLSISFQFISS